MIMRTSLRRMFPFARIKLSISRRYGTGGNPQNRMKRSHRIKAAVEPENVFVEVRLQMLWLDTAMMRSSKPSFQVAENEMDHRQVGLGLVRVASERQGLMAVSHPGKAGIASPAIGAQDRTQRDVLFDKAGKRVGAPIWHDTKPQPPSIHATSVLP